ncbi:MAG: DNA-binding response regulator, partial [Prevotella sp.]|nr:DNA-binding response regulator [Prevotella sp.]
MKILIIEDEHRLSDSMKDYLEGQNYLCEQAFDFKTAKMMAGT